MNTLAITKTRAASRVKLTPRQMQVMTLRGTGLSIPQIAKKIGVAEGTVCALMAQARKRFKQGDRILQTREDIISTIDESVTMVKTAVCRGIELERFTEVGARTALALLSGVGVLTPKIEVSSRTETVETRRIEANLRLDAARQFGVAIPVEYEIVQEIAHTDSDITP